MSPAKFDVTRTRYLKKSHTAKQEEDTDSETGAVAAQKKKPEGKTISREMVLELEFKAMVAEGQILYYRNEYYRAIEAFTKALNSPKEEKDPGILIDRANCYIAVGNPKAALLDINELLQKKPDDTRGILAKAEAFFSMGEFEFALVFFEKGQAIRKDITAFRDGIAKATHAILHSINGDALFQPNPNFAISRPRKPLLATQKRTVLETPEDPDEPPVVELLPEKVPPLS
jgi:tetratricopeptide (TPR) repeat protein